MALTTEQEKQLASLLQAFQNAKRLSDLPDAGASNPFGLLVEVLDTDGETKKANLAAMLPYLEEQCAYGIEFDTGVSSPACTRIGNMSLHRTLPIQSRMRGCLLDDNGNVTEYLPPLDWSTAVRDGSRGQVMVEIPEHWRRFITDGTKRRVMLSEHPLPGYHRVPRAYVSAYEASIQRSTGKLASVANTTPDYRGGDNNTSYDGTARSLLGRPATSISRTNFRNHARLRKPGSTEWNCMTYEMQKTIIWLFAVEYATLNSQAAYDAEPTAEGFRQGGLGSGVTNIDAKTWSAWNGSNPLIPCGYSDNLGNRTGVADYNMPQEYNDKTEVVNIPRYRGVENPFGHIWKWIDGINVRVSPDIADGGNGMSEIFICDDPSKFKDNGYDGYHHVGNGSREQGYIKEIIFGEEGDIIPTLCSGGGNLFYFCDYHYTEIRADETLCGMYSGGCAYDRAPAGLSTSSTKRIPSDENVSVGTRLCFIPNE